MPDENARIRALCLVASERYALYEALCAWRMRINPDEATYCGHGFRGLLRLGAYGDMVTRHMAVADDTQAALEVSDVR